MAKQIAVRLPDELVAFVDGRVKAGAERSRATLLTRALERERRRIIAERDAQILARTGPNADLDALADHAVAHPIDVD